MTESKMRITKYLGVFLQRLITGTILFYISKKYFSVVDAEDDFSEVKSPELLGIRLDDNKEI